LIVAISAAERAALLLPPVLAAGALSVPLL
jgi:hypothetical protein